MDTRTIQLRLEVSGSKPTVGTVRVLDRNPAQRAGRALGILGLCWAVGAGCIFIPLVHFVVPAVMLVVGVVLAVARWRESSSIVALEVACPKCLKSGSLVTSGPVRDGGSLHCDGCGFQVTMHFEAAAPSPDAAPAIPGAP